ncbi:MAG: HdeD family acid-resistance protein [Verrucomicrobiaceae bacterium]|nr:MAG: HdeD family acid-resistance protein [Verrucomicrobiaceae bacterium]
MVSATSAVGSPGRGWFIFGGALSILVGMFAIAAPQIFSFILTQLIGAFCLVSGLISLFQAIFGKHRSHRFLSSLSAVIRIAAGSMLFFYTVAGMAALTLILAAVFLTEGIVCIFTSFRMRDNPAWIWLLLNGVVALILGGMIYSRWPVDAAWLVGLLYGIQSIFSGSAMLMVGLKTPKA